MKITEVNSLKSKLKLGKVKSSSNSTAFSSLVDKTEDVEETQAAQNISPIAAASVINEVEEVTPQGRRKKSIQHGHDLLDELEEIRNGLLLGTLDQQTIEKAHKKALASRDITDDPELEEIINEIEIRAAVELAKLGIL